MDVLLNDDEREIRDQARSFLESACSIALVRACEQKSKYSPELWQEIVGLGWLETSLPESIGGLGLSLSSLGLLFEEIGRHLAPAPFASTMVPLLILAKHGQARHRALLDQVRKGERLLCYAIQEPDAAWSPDAIKLSGNLEGDAIVLNGTKMFVDNFAIADRCLVAFRMSGQQSGLTLAIVDTSAQNLVRTDLVPTAKDSESLVRFDGVHIPLSNVVGEIGHADGAVREMMDLSALFHAAQLVGAGRMATELAIEYAKVRYAFEQPIGSFQAIQHMCADMINGVDGAELLCREASWKMGRAQGASIEISQAKAFASEKCLMAARSAQQIHGGIGFMMEFDQHLWYRRVVSWSLRSGTASEHRRHIASFLFGRGERMRLDGQPSI